MAIAGLWVTAAFIALAPTASAASICVSENAEGAPFPDKDNGPLVVMVGGSSMVVSVGIYNKDPGAKSNGVYVSLYDCNECPPEDPHCWP